MVSGGVKVGWEVRSSLYRLLGEDQAGWERRSGGAAHGGPSGGQSRRGTPAGANGLVRVSNVPDRVGQPAGDVDLGDPSASECSRTDWPGETNCGMKLVKNAAISD
jgi:hypothetical protein